MWSGPHSNDAHTGHDFRIMCVFVCVFMCALCLTRRRAAANQSEAIYCVHTHTREWPRPQNAHPAMQPFTGTGRGLRSHHHHNDEKVCAGRTTAKWATEPSRGLWGGCYAVNGHRKPANMPQRHAHIFFEMNMLQREGHTACTRFREVWPGGGLCGRLVRSWAVTKNRVGGVMVRRTHWKKGTEVAEAVHVFRADGRCDVNVSAIFACDDLHERGFEWHNTRSGTCT